MMPVHSAFVSWPHSCCTGSLASSKSQFVSSKCVLAPLGHRRPVDSIKNDCARRPRIVFQGSMAGSGNLQESDEEDMDAEIELTEEEEELCGDFRADLPLLNKVILTGRLGADPTIRNIGDDTKVCNFSLAVTTEYDPDEGQDQDRTSWFDVEAWGSTADYIARIGKKGMRVGVSGPININAWTGRDGELRETPIVTADTFEILQSRSEQMPSLMDRSNPYPDSRRDTSEYKGKDSGKGTAQNLNDLPF